jgi:hypothetical protein
MSTLETNLIQPSTGTALTVGASGDTITVPSGATFNVAGTLQSGGSAITQGITMADQWRITANLSSNGTNVVGTNWERNDTNFDKIGTGMTESSGIFTFPSTGIYIIIFNGLLYADNAVAYAGFHLQQTTDNSSYTDAIYGYGGNASASGRYSGFYGNGIFDVTNTTTHKIRLRTTSPSTVTFQGSTSIQATGITFIRIGNT